MHLLFLPSIMASMAVAQGRFDTKGYVQIRNIWGEILVALSLLFIKIYPTMN
jgi:hypothetical protein